MSTARQTESASHPGVMLTATPSSGTPVAQTMTLVGAPNTADAGVGPL